MNPTEPPSSFVRLVFFAAGIYGLFVVTPPCFLKGQFAKQAPPAIAHPEFYYYRFTGGTVLWQIIYLARASDPIRYWPMILLGAVGLASYDRAAVVLHAQHWLPLSTFGISMVDWIFVALFLASYRRTRISGRGWVGAASLADSIGGRNEGEGQRTSSASV
jgi:hypothetical protein